MSKIIGNTVGMGLPKPDLRQTDPSKGDYVKGKDAIPTRVSQLTNDKGYLTQHQDISGKADKTGLTLGIHTDGMLYIFVDGQPTGNGIELPSGGISGYIDSENNIVINNLPEGSYTVRYEMADGSTVDIGELTVAAEPPEPDEPVAPAYINQIPISTDADGNLFVGVNGEAGYKSGYRLSLSAGNEKAQDGYTVTGFIPAKEGDVIRAKNIAIPEEDNYSNFAAYDSNKQPIFTASSCGSTLYRLFVECGSEDNGVYTATLNQSVYNMLYSGHDFSYIRIGSSVLNDESIITINQEIV